MAATKLQPTYEKKSFKDFSVLEKTGEEVV